MAQDTNPNRDDYQRARAEAKAAAARAKAMRPWYRKKRFLLGIPLLAFVLLVVIGALAAPTPEEEAVAASTTEEDREATAQSRSGTSDDDAAEQPTATATVAADSDPVVGDTVAVGDIDLTLVSVNTAFDPTSYNQFNTANTAVAISVVNARGDDYSFSPYLAMKLIDDNGIAHDPTSCTGCPNEVGEYGSGVEMVEGGRFEGVVYFEIPEGRTLTELRYQPLFSTNKVAFDLE